MPHVLKVFCLCALIPTSFLNTHSLFHIHLTALEQEFFFCHVMLDIRLISVLPSLDPTPRTTFE